MKVESKSAAAHPITQAFDQLMRGIFRKPESKLVAEYHGDELHLCCLPHAADFRIIAGTKGRSVRALGYLALQMGAAMGITCKFSLEESYIGEPEDSRAFEQDPAFDVESAVVLVSQFWRLLFPHGKLADITAVRDNDRLTIFIKQHTPRDISLIKALDEVFYPYGFGQGMILKVRPA